MKKPEMFNNPESPFTELFSLILYRSAHDGIFAMDSSELQAMQQHIDNAVGILLLGLQGIG